MSLSAPNKDEMVEQVVAALRTCYDPEIPLNIYDLGLIYNVDVDDDRVVRVRMTLTSPMCPAAGYLPVEVQDKVAALPGVKEAKVDIVWDPPWGPDRLTDAARLALGL